METVARVSVVYVLLLAAMRVLGKRELSQLSPFELVTLLLIPEMFQQALVRDDFSMVTALVASATLLSLVYLTSARGAGHRGSSGSTHRVRAAGANQPGP
jgi:uncharacterized membrane protein YcaP (DUF421 family)